LRSYKIISIVRGIGVPEEFLKIIEECIIIGYTAKAILVGDALKEDYLPGYIELWCSNPEETIMKAKKLKLRVYGGKRHITITDKYTACHMKIILNHPQPRKTKTIKVKEHKLKIEKATYFT